MDFLMFLKYYRNSTICGANIFNFLVKNHIFPNSAAFLCVFNMVVFGFFFSNAKDKQFFDFPEDLVS